MITDIEPGSRTAWTVKLLLTSWVSRDEDKVAAALSVAESDQSDVLRYLLALVGGQVDDLAALLGVPYTVALDRVLQVLALTEDNLPGQAMREAVTAWTVNGGMAADALPVALDSKGVDEGELIPQFLTTAVLLTHLVARFSHTSTRAVRDSWWQLLGTID